MAKRKKPKKDRDVKLIIEVIDELMVEDFQSLETLRILRKALTREQ